MGPTARLADTMKAIIARLSFNQLTAIVFGIIFLFSAIVAIFD